MISALLCLLVLQVFPSSNVSDQVETTTRLNLRQCPAVHGCRVLQTLPASTRLEVLERKDDWLKVRTIQEGQEGWVSAGYTGSVASGEPVGGKSFFSTLSNWKVPAFLLGAILLLAFVMPKIEQDGDEHANTSPGLIVVTLALGFAFILNQFGPLLQELLVPHVDIAFLSPIWTINGSYTPVGYPKILLALVVLSVLIGLAVPAAGGGRTSYVQGLGTGFLLFPASACVAVVTVALGWLIIKIFLVIKYILGIIMIPFVWLFTHLVYPVLVFIAKPFVWLWENGLRDLFLWLMTPFIWLWETILAPIAGFLVKYIVRPVVAILLGLVASTLVLLPFAIVGSAIYKSISSSLGVVVGHRSLFSQGMTMGFFLFDSCLLIVLGKLDVLQSTPPVSLFVMMALPVIVLLRLMVFRERAGEGEDRLPFTDSFRRYCKESKIELLSTCIVLPALLVVSIWAQGDE